MRRIARENLTRFLSLLVLAVLVLAMCAGRSFSTRAYADTGKELNYDNTNVLDDLGSSTIDGKPFNVNDYPRNPFGTAQMITFVEYCYSQYDNGFGNYALYVYIYNPALVDFATASTQNKIEISTDFYYRNEVGHVGDVKDYAKFSLMFCNASGGDYENLFLKFRVVDEDNVILNAEREHERQTGNRFYHISGIELFELGGSSTNAHDYWVNKYYQFSGYAEGYGDSEKFPFSCDATGNGEAVQLNVKHTYFRTETSSVGENHQNQLDSVYFAVPKRLFDTYGKLQRIKAEWYEYKTKDYLVTSNTALYNALQEYIAKTVPSGVGDPPSSSLSNVFTNGDIGYALGAETNFFTDGDLISAEWGWNLDSGVIERVCDFLTLVFLTEGIEEYDPYETDIDGTVEGNELYDRIVAYDESYNGGTLPVKDGTISADLFEDDIDDSRKVDSEQGKIQKGYSYYDFDADTDLQKLVSWSDGDPSFWENWEEYGFWDTLFGNIPSETGREFSPIQVLEESDLSGTRAEVAQRLYVNVNDVEDMKKAYDEAVTVNPLDPEDEECYLVLFRFATSDYYSAPVNIFEKAFTSLGYKQYWNEAYVFSQSVFLDFDIIQLTFNLDGVYHVIPAVSDPIDIVNDGTPPSSLDDGLPEWLKWLFGALALIVLLVIFMPILPYIIKAVVWVILLPFRLIAAIVKGIQKAAKKKPKQAATSPPKVQAPQPKVVYRTAKAAGKDSQKTANKDRK